MTDHMPSDVLNALDAARRAKARRKSCLSVVTDGETYPILRLLPEGFTVDAAEVSHLRGLVEVYEGSTLVSRCLIVASGIEGSELICRMKWSTAARATPPLDYVRDDGAPTGYLTGPSG